MPILRRSLTPQEKFRALLKMRKKEVKQAFKEGRISYGDYKRIKKDIRIMIARTRPGLFGRYKVATVDASHLKELLSRTHGMHVDLPEGAKVNLYYRPFARVTSVEQLVMRAVHGVNPPIGKIGGAHLLHSIMTEDLSKLFPQASEQEIKHTKESSVEGTSLARRVERVAKKIRLGKPPVSGKPSKAVSGPRQLTLDEISAVVMSKKEGGKEKEQQTQKIKRERPRNKKKKPIPPTIVKQGEEGSKGLDQKTKTKPGGLTDKKEMPRATKKKAQVERVEPSEEQESKITKEELTFNKFFKTRVKNVLSKAGKVKIAGELAKEVGKSIAYDADYVRLKSKFEKLGLDKEFEDRLYELSITEDLAKRRKIIRELESELNIRRRLRRLGMDFNEFSAFFGLSRGKTRTTRITLAKINEMIKDLSKMVIAHDYLVKENAISERQFINTKKFLEQIDNKYGGHFYAKFLLAKLHENVGKWDEARKYYEEANELARKTNLEKYQSMISEHKTRFESKSKTSKGKPLEKKLTDKEKRELVVEIMNNHKQLGFGEISSYSDILDRLSRYPHFAEDFEKIIKQSTTASELRRNIDRLVNSELSRLVEVVSSGNLPKLEAMLKKTGHPDLYLAKGMLLYNEDKLRALNYFRDLEKSGKDKVGLSAYMIARILAERGEVDEALKAVRKFKGKYTHPDTLGKLSTLEVSLIKRSAELARAREASEKRITAEKKEQLVVDFFKRNRTWGLEDVKSVDEIRNWLSTYPEVSNRLDTIIRKSKTEKELLTNLNGFSFDYHDLLVNHNMARQALSREYSSDKLKLKALRNIYRKTKHPEVKAELERLETKLKVQTTVKRAEMILSGAGDWADVVRKVDSVLKYSDEPDKFTPKSGTLTTLLSGTISKAKIAKKLSDLGVPAPKEMPEMPENLLNKDALKRAKDVQYKLRDVFGSKSVSDAISKLSNFTGIEEGELTNALYRYMRYPNDKHILNIIDSVGKFKTDLALITRLLNLPEESANNLESARKALSEHKFVFGFGDKLAYQLQLDKSEVDSAIDKLKKGDPSEWSKLNEKIVSFADLERTVNKLVSRRDVRQNLGDWINAVLYLPSIVKTTEDAKNLARSFRETVNIAEQLNNLGVPLPMAIHDGSILLGDSIKFLNASVVENAKNMISEINSAMAPLGMKKRVRTVNEIIDMLSKGGIASIVSDKEYKAFVTGVVQAALLGKVDNFKKEMGFLSNYVEKARVVLENEKKMMTIPEELVVKGEAPREIVDGWTRLISESDEWTKIDEIISNFGSLADAENTLSILGRKINAVKELAKVGLPPNSNVLKDVDMLERYSSVAKSKLEDLKKIMESEGFEISNFSDAISLLKASPVFDAEEAIWAYLRDDLGTEDIQKATRQVTASLLLGTFNKEGDTEFISNLKSYKSLIKKNEKLATSLIKSLEDEIESAESLSSLDEIVPKLDRALLLLDGTNYEGRVGKLVDKLSSRFNDMFGGKLREAYDDFLKTGDVSPLTKLLSYDKLDLAPKNVSQVLDDLSRTLAFLEKHDPEIYKKHKLDELHRLVKSAIAGKSGLTSAFVMENGRVVLTSLLSVMDKEKFLNRVKSELGPPLIDEAVDLVNKVKSVSEDMLYELPPFLSSEDIEIANAKLKIIEGLKDRSISTELGVSEGLGTILDHLRDRVKTLYGVGLLSPELSVDIVKKEKEVVLRNVLVLLSVPRDKRNDVIRILGEKYPGHKVLALPTTVVTSSVKQVMSRLSQPPKNQTQNRRMVK